MSKISKNQNGCSNPKQHQNGGNSNWKAIVSWIEERSCCWAWAAELSASHCFQVPVGFRNMDRTDIKGRGTYYILHVVCNAQNWSWSTTVSIYRFVSTKHMHACMPRQNRSSRLTQLQAEHRCHARKLSIVGSGACSEVLYRTFTHGRDKHKLAFETVVIPIQYQMLDNGSRMFCAWFSYQINSNINSTVVLPLYFKKLTLLPFSSYQSWDHLEIVSHSSQDFHDYSLDSLEVVSRK